MRNGQLNKAELAKLARQFRELDDLLESLPAGQLTAKESDVMGKLIKARNAIGEILRWQDFDGAWKAAQRAKGGDQ